MKIRKGGAIVAILVMTLVMAMIPAGCYAQKAEKTEKTEKTEASIIGYHTKASLKSIKVGWKKQKGVSYYKLFRLDVTKKRSSAHFAPKKSDYKLIKKLSAKKRSFKDKKVKRGHWYSYMLEGYSKKGGKVRLVCTTYDHGSYEADIVGLAPPSLVNGGNGEFDSNSPHALYLWMDSTGGITPKGFQLYRKTAGAKSYKKIQSKPNKDKQSCVCNMVDKTVKPGKTYTYKVRTWAKKGGKKYYSAFSNKVTLPAVNLVGRYTAQNQTPKDSPDQLVVKLSSHKYNGVTTFLSAKCGVIDEEEAETYEGPTATLKFWSTDGKNWKSVPRKGVALSAGKTVFLKYSIALDKAGNPCFDGRTAGSFTMEEEYGEVNYAGPGDGPTIFNMDLKKGTARAFRDFD